MQNNNIEMVEKIIKTVLEEVDSVDRDYLEDSYSEFLNLSGSRLREEANEEFKKSCDEWINKNYFFYGDLYYLNGDVESCLYYIQKRGNQ